MKQSGEDAFHLWVKQGKHMIAKVGNRHPNYQALYVLWFLKMVDLKTVSLSDAKGCISNNIPYRYL